MLEVPLRQVLPESLEASMSAIKRLAEDWIQVTQPNQEIEGFDIEEVRTAAKLILELQDQELEDLEPRVAQVLACIPNPAVDYGEGEREALVIKARLGDLRTAVFLLQSEIGAVRAAGTVSAEISPDVSAQLASIRSELTGAREDIAAIKDDIDSKSGISVELGCFP